MSDFPYTMRDVASLLPLQIRHKKAISIDVDCPFCNAKGKMNINFEKCVFNCNRCKTHGGMVDLYARYFGISNSQANEEIYAVVCRHSTPRVPLTPMPAITETPVAPQRASETVIDQTLRTLLEMLTLAQPHKEQLLRRGLTEEQITRYMYRSTPAFGYRRIVSNMLEMGCTLEGVPGFYKTKDGAWTLNCNPKYTGFFVPVVSVNGLVQGCQIRLDKPFSDAKYIWFSSTGKNCGTPSGSPVHCVGDPCAADVYVTEGALKATIAHCLSGKTFVAVAGAGQFNALGQTFDTLLALGTKRISEAYDMDKFKNENVQKGAVQMMDLARRKGFIVRSLHWDPTFKGVDDYYLAKSKHQKP